MYRLWGDLLQSYKVDEYLLVKSSELVIPTTCGTHCFNTSCFFLLLPSGTETQRPFRPIEKDVCSDKQLEVIGSERIHAVLKTTNTLTLLLIWCNCSLGSYNLLLCWVCLLFCLSLNSSWNRNLLLVPAEILVFTTSCLSLPMTPTTQIFNDFATLICESSHCLCIQRPKSL
jgi:hypothetical protein